MLREIHEQPKVIAETLPEGFKQARDAVEQLNASKLSMVYFTGSGTSYHACLAANYALSTLTRISSTTLPASEFSSWVRQSGRTGTAVVAVSQSGESVDVLAAVRSASSAGMRTVAVTNSAGSSLANETEFQLLAKAGEERAVTATKSFTATLAAAYAFVLELARAVVPEFASNGRLERSLRNAPNQMQITIDLSEDHAKALTSKFADKQLYFILGSGPNLSSAFEGALKLKESCNLYAEGFATREFLHGPMQLVDSRTPVFLLEGSQESEQVAQLARSFVKFGAPTVVIKRKTADTTAEGLDTIDVAPDIEDVFSPLVYVIPLQLYAFYTALERGLNPDSPVKLTKVVR
jgi:glucosamine--fructose-6-phosphate aminotransferase (isomerizing)